MNMTHERLAHTEVCTFEEQHVQTKDERRAANYSDTARWPETKLIIIMGKWAQKKPAAVPRPRHNPIERLLAFVMIYKVTSQTDLL